MYGTTAAYVTAGIIAALAVVVTLLMLSSHRRTAANTRTGDEAGRAVGAPESSNDSSERELVDCAR
jgi:hypothetical protein